MYQDSSTVTLTVLTTQKKLTKTLINNNYQTTTNMMYTSNFTFNEIPNGKLEFLDALQAAGVAYLSEWTEGNEYNAGCDSCRFTSTGEVIVKRLLDHAANPQMNVLMGLIDQPDALRAFILAHQQERYILPWFKQEEYGKLYRTTQLITT